MNLIFGKLMERDKAIAMLDDLQCMICDTLQQGAISTQQVIAACDALSQKLNDKQHLPLLLEMGIEQERAKEQLRLTKMMLSRAYLTAWMERSFGENADQREALVPLDREERVTEYWAPLGVLLHIAAGNTQGLPVFSVIEGLLTGNINLLKLPGLDDGISILMIHELIGFEPALAGYVHAFDIPSEDIQSMRKLADVADAIVVWGGDAAVSAVRQMSKPDTKLIEWGHKISFAYATKEGTTDQALHELAKHICDTEQLLCSSCQGIFLDSADINEVRAFAHRFLRVLDEAAQNGGERNVPQTVLAQVTLNRYTEELGTLRGDGTMYRTDRCSVTAYGDSALTPSLLFRNCWVKPLPKDRIIHALKPRKNHLQTAALLCGESEREGIEHSLIKAGVVRVSKGENMADAYCGMPHDGEYALKRYVKRVVVE